MSARLGVIASPAVSLGVRLAGVRSVVVESRDAAAGPRYGDAVSDIDLKRACPHPH